MVGNVPFTQSRPAPHAIVSQVFPVVAHIDVHKRALLHHLCHTTEELIGIMNRAVVGIVHLLRLGGGILEMHSSRGKGCILAVIVFKGSMTAFIIHKEQKVLPSCSLIQHLLHLRDCGPRAARGIEFLPGAVAQHHHHAVILQFLSTTTPKEGIHIKAMRGKQIQHRAGMRQHLRPLLVHIPPGIGQHGNLRLARVAGS